MTKNYSIGKIKVTPIPARYKERSNEEREQEAKERGVSIFLVDHYAPNPDAVVETHVDWVSHGNYAIYQANPRAKVGLDAWKWIELEEEYFDQIIDAFQTKEKADDPFEPFWQADMPLRGMHPMQTRLKAYHYKEDALMIQDSKINPFTGVPSDYIVQLGFTIEDFKKIRDIALQYKDKPIHFVQFG